MAVIRLKPTSYTINYRNSSVVNAEIFVSNREPEDIASSSAYYAHLYGSARYEGPSVSLYFPAVNVNNITNITLKYRAYDASHQSGTGASEGAIELCADNPSQVIKLCALSTNNLVMTDNDCLSYNIPQEYWSIILESNWYLRVKACTRATGTANTYAAPLALDIEYTPTKDLKIGVNKLKKAILNNTLIKKIYKGSNLLFKYSRLPDNFKELEYIQSQWYPSTYIDTGVAWNASTKIEAEFITRSTGSNGTKLFVATQGDSSMPGFTYLYIDTSNQVIGSNVSVSTYVVGADSVEATYTSSTTSNIYLTAWSDVYWACTFRYKNIKIYNGNTLLRNYIPCYRVSDGIAGLYDLVNNVFYASDGSSNYLKGPETEIELPTAYQKVEYIEGSGDIYIDTNYVCKNDSTFYFDYKDEQVHSEVVYANYFYTPYYRLVRSPNHTNTVLEIRNTTATDSIDVPSTPYNTRNKVEFLIDKVLDASSNVLVTYPHTSEKLGINSHLILFRGYYYNSWDNYGYYKLYGFKVFKGNGSTLVKNYVPCYRKSDNVIGLYETVQGQFITGTGTGSFTKGPNIV